MDCRIFCSSDLFACTSFVVMIGRIINLSPTSSVIPFENPPIVPFGTREETKLPTSVKINTEISIITPWRMSIFLFFLYVHALTPDARTSDASAIPIAWYAGICRNVISIGETTAAAESPARPVPRPAPRPATIHTINSVIVIKSLLSPFYFPITFFRISSQSRRNSFLSSSEIPQNRDSPNSF